MDQNFIDLLRDNINEVKQDLRLAEQRVGDKVKEVEVKVDKLLEFKWQIIGGSVVMSVIITVMIQLVLKNI